VPSKDVLPSTTIRSQDRLTKLRLTWIGALLGDGELEGDVVGDGLAATAAAIEAEAAGVGDATAAEAAGEGAVADGSGADSSGEGETRAVCSGAEEI
jgi:hypothetical protein